MSLAVLSLQQAQISVIQITNTMTMMGFTSSTKPQELVKLLVWLTARTVAPCHTSWGHWWGPSHTQKSNKGSTTMQDCRRCLERWRKSQAPAPFSVAEFPCLPFHENVACAMPIHVRGVGVSFLPSSAPIKPVLKGPKTQRCGSTASGTLGVWFELLLRG